jgi:hypothetical protein
MGESPQTIAFIRRPSRKLAFAVLAQMENRSVRRSHGLTLPLDVPPKTRQRIATRSAKSQELTSSDRGGATLDPGRLQENLRRVAMS